MHGDGGVDVCSGSAVVVVAVVVVVVVVLAWFGWGGVDR